MKSLDEHLEEAKIYNQTLESTLECVDADKKSQVMKALSDRLNGKGKSARLSVTAFAKLIADFTGKKITPAMVNGWMKRKFNQ